MVHHARFDCGNWTGGGTNVTVRTTEEVVYYRCCHAPPGDVGGQMEKCGSTCTYGDTVVLVCNTIHAVALSVQAVNYISIHQTKIVVIYKFMKFK